MAGILITLQAFMYGVMAYFHAGGWPMWETMTPLLGGMRGGRSWWDIPLVDTESQKWVLGTFP